MIHAIVCVNFGKLAGRGAVCGVVFLVMVMQETLDFHESSQFTDIQGTFKG